MKLKELNDQSSIDMMQELVYFSLNYPDPDLWIRYVSGEKDQSMFNHLREKFSHYYQMNRDNAFITFFVNLTGDRQRKLCEFIINQKPLYESYHGDKYLYTDEQLSDLIVTALEGGSNYWLMLDDNDIIDTPGESSFAERVYYTLKTGKTINLYDCEDDPDSDPIGNLSMRKLVRNQWNWLDNHPDRHTEIVEEAYDAETADVWLQFNGLGEVVYA